MSDSSRVQLAGIEETTWGDTPASALAAIRYTTESLGQRVEKTRSDEVRSDRQTTDIVPVGSNADGGFDFEASYDAHDIYLEGAFSEDWSTDSGFSAATVDAAAADNSFNDSGSGFPTLVAGQWIRVAGFSTNPTNNGWFEVVTPTAAKIIVTGGTLITEAVGDTVTLSDATLANGIVEKSYSLEKDLSDITQFFGFTGNRVNTLSFSIASRQKVTGSFSFLGKSGALAGATIGSGAYDAAPTAQILNASSNVARLLEGGAVFGTGIFVQKLDIEYSNNLRVVDGVGQAEAVAIGLGRWNCTGSMDVLFEDEVLFNKYLNNTDSSIAVAIEDQAGNGYMISFPAVVYSDGDVTGIGNDGEVQASLQWEAKMHATQAIMARIDKRAAP